MSIKKKKGKGGKGNKGKSNKTRRTKSQDNSAITDKKRVTEGGEDEEIEEPDPPLSHPGRDMMVQTPGKIGDNSKPVVNVKTDKGS